MTLDYGWRVTASTGWRPLALATLLCGACALAGCQPAAEGPGKTAYSVQMHVHGPYSEGPASMEMHSAEAADVGADVIWWSDHGWRIASFRHVSRFGFEHLEESIDHDEPWKAQFLGIKKSLKRRVPFDLRTARHFERVPDLN